MQRWSCPESRSASAQSPSGCSNRCHNHQMGLSVGPGMGAGRGLQNRRQPNGGEACGLEVVCMAAKWSHHYGVLGSPSAGEGTARFRTEFVEPLKQHSHERLLFAYTKSPEGDSRRRFTN